MYKKALKYLEGKAVYTTDLEGLTHQEEVVTITQAIHAVKMAVEETLAYISQQAKPLQQAIK